MKKYKIFFGGIVFLTAILGGHARAETELRFERATFFADPGDQIGNAVKAGEGRLHVAGAEASSNSKSLWISYALPPSGTPLSSFRWQHEPASSSDVFNNMAVTGEGLYFAGRSLPKTGSSAGTLVKFSLDQTAGSNAVALWTVKPQFFPGNQEGALQAVLTVEEGGLIFIYVAGHASSRPNNSTAVLAKYDKDGKLVWSKILSNPGERNKSAGTALAVLNGFIYVAGYTGTGGKGVGFDNTPLNLTLWKYDFSGQQIWTKSESSQLYFKGAKDGVKVDIVPSGTGLYVTALKNKGKSAGVLILKYNEKNSLIWSSEWPVKSGEKVPVNARAIGIAGGTDRIYVAGETQQNSGKDSNVFLLEVDKEYGSILASHDYGEANMDEKALGVQSAGSDVFVVGSKIATGGKSKDKKFTGSDLMLLRFMPLPVTEVTIDIDPSNSKAKKDTIPVAILSSAKFNAASEVKPSSLTFGRTGNEASWNSCAMKDVNTDGRLDLLCYFKTQFRFQNNLRDVLQAGDTEGVLKGQTASGSRLRGADSVQNGLSGLMATTPPVAAKPSAPSPTSVSQPIPSSASTPVVTSPTTPTTLVSQPSPSISATTTTSSTSPTATTVTSPVPAVPTILVSQPAPSTTTTSPTLPTTTAQPTTQPTSIPTSPAPTTTISAIASSPTVTVTPEPVPTKTLVSQPTPSTSTISSPSPTPTTPTTSSTSPTTTTVTSPTTTTSLTTTQPTSPTTTLVSQPTSSTTPTTTPSPTTTSTTPKTTTVTSPEPTSTTTLVSQPTPSTSTTSSTSPTATVLTTTQPTSTTAISEPTSAPTTPATLTTTETAPTLTTLFVPLVHATENPTLSPTTTNLVSKEAGPSNTSGANHTGRGSVYEGFLRSDGTSVSAHGQLKEAGREAGKSVLKSNPDLARAYSDLGKEAMKQRKPAKAIDYYKEALQHEPKSAEIHNNLGLALLEAGKLEEARDHFTEALRLNPDDTLARASLERVLSKMRPASGEIRN